MLKTVLSFPPILLILVLLQLPEVAGVALELSPLNVVVNPALEHSPLILQQPLMLHPLPLLLQALHLAQQLLLQYSGHSQ